MHHKVQRITRIHTEAFHLHDGPDVNEPVTTFSENSSIRIWLALIDLSVFVLTIIIIIGTVQQLDSFVNMHNGMMLALNLALAFGFCFCFRYFDLSEGRYSLGKALLMGISLWCMNAVVMWVLSSNIPLASLATSGIVLGVWALVSGVLHYEFSKPFMLKKQNSPYYLLELRIKRVFDFTVSALGLIAVSPIMLSVSILLSLESSGSPVFSQIRIGKDENRFWMYKFRSMIKDADSLPTENKTILFKREDDPRVTRLGSVIRKLSIDELPQLFNVLKGEMSLVGPRPPLEKEFELMNWYHKRKFEAIPGLTGHWQIVGRVKNQRAFNSVAVYDVYYIENWCLIEDLKILLKTIPVVLLQKGAC